MTKPIILSPDQKALQVNLDSKIYGTFVEIGAGQEVVRHFFRAGMASGTIAKTMSAYDKDFSDSIYGKEKDGRYVCESRLQNMIEKEYALLEERLNRSQHKETLFFAFADTMTTINHEKTMQGHGWMGIRFQLDPKKEANNVIIHVRLNDVDAKLQQETIGIIGTNLVYACFFNHEDPKQLLKSLYDNLSRDNIEVDMIKITGPDFKQVDNRLLSLTLVKERMTDAVIFSPDGVNQQAADMLYKKNILTIRGSFRPVTKVNINMLKNGLTKFLENKRVKKENLQLLFEITLSNLKMEGEINEKDFLDRADILCSLGYTVMISNYKKYYKLVEYLSQFTRARMGLIIGVDNLLEMFDEAYYRNLNGGIMEAFGIIVTRDIKIYLYPYKPNDKVELQDSNNIAVHPRVKPIYDYLFSNGRIEDLDYDLKVLHIFSRKVLELIKSCDNGKWEDMVPEGVAEIIKEKSLFGSKCEYNPEKN
ncbi:MAG TPA: TonB-dependent receptor [Flavobacteriales bacterium]|nr:TonB-dependent receptor [Flavobacteriales bacterium]